MPDTPGHNHHLASAVTEGPTSDPSRHDSGKWHGEDIDEDDDPIVGSVLSNTYEVLRILGEGGMGRVYEAQHTRIASKRFAIKALHPEYTRRKEVLVRFQREVEAAASIQSPHVVGVFDVDQTEDGRPFLVSEMLDGVDFGDYLEDHGPISVPLAVYICRQICEALIAAHEKNIVHRDMKPENVFLCGDANRPLAKVLDFGISRLEGADGNTLTKTGVIMGTPSYMAPEQAKGLRVDQRADVYAVGAILYHAVTGKLPFDRNDATATLAALLTEEPERPRALMPTLPEPFELVIQRAMASEPEDRYQNMEELDAALALFDQQDMIAPGTDRRPKMPSKVTQSSMVDAAEHARQIADARPQLLVYFALGAMMVLFSLFTVIGGTLRLFQDDTLPTLSGLQAGIIAAVLIAALATPSFLISKKLIQTTWSNTARVVEVLRLVRDPVLAALAGYGLVAIGLRVLETFVLRTQIGIAWPFWDLLLPFAGMLTGGVVFLMRQGSLPRLPGTAASVSVGVTLAAVVIGLGASMRADMDFIGGEDETQRRRPRAKAGTSASAPDASGPQPSTTSSTKSGDPPLNALMTWGVFSDALNKNKIEKALDAFERFLELDPDGGDDRNVRQGAMQLVLKACPKKQSKLCLRTVSVLSEKMGPGGIDVLFELIVTKGGTGATWHATQLLQKEKVLERGSKQMQIAYSLRRANSCPKVTALLPVARAIGDHRSIRELKITNMRGNQCRARGCCMANDQRVKDTITAIDTRLKQAP